MNKLLLILIVGITALMPAISFGQDIEYVGSALGFHVVSACVDGNTAYCAIQEGLLVLDISNYDNPPIVGRYLIAGKCKRYC